MKEFKGVKGIEEEIKILTELEKKYNLRFMEDLREDLPGEYGNWSAFSLEDGKVTQSLIDLPSLRILDITGTKISNNN